jgi:hypothetical protein
MFENRIKRKVIINIVEIQWWTVLDIRSCLIWLSFVILINTHWSQKKDYDIWHWKFSFGLGQAHTNMTGLNQLLWSKPSPLDNWIFNSNTYITNDNQIKQLRISSTVHHWISTMLIITFLFILFSNIPMMRIVLWHHIHCYKIISYS